MNAPGNTLDWELTVLIGFTDDEMRDTPIFFDLRTNYWHSDSKNWGLLNNVGTLYWEKGYTPYA